jgi:hypothetical protein
MPPSPRQTAALACCKHVTVEPGAGSVPPRLRNAFIDLLEDETQGGEEACQLLRQLVASTDTLPQEYCDMLELPEGSTFGDAARRLQAQLGCES